MTFAVFSSPIGPIGVEADDREILEIELLTKRTAFGTPNAVIVSFFDQLKRYFAGTLKDFTVPFTVKGTPFRSDVLRAIRSIPYGETITYRELAHRSGHPQAVRAVGGVCAANPFPLLIPCHRVIRSDGKWGNYQAGTDHKRFLIETEKRHR